MPFLLVGFSNISSAIRWSRLPIATLFLLKLRVSLLGSFTERERFYFLNWGLTFSFDSCLLAKNTLLNCSTLDLFKLSTLWGLRLRGWCDLTLPPVLYLLLALIDFWLLDTRELDLEETDFTDTEDFLRSYWQYILFWELILW